MILMCSLRSIFIKKENKSWCTRSIKCEVVNNMTPVQKALWYIESRFRDELSLTDVAQASGVSKHYLIRAFGECTGMSVMQYVRRRRLSEAAKVLAGGAPEIISVAMMAGYYSHEAFTRAFRDEFGHSPSQVRKMQQTSSLSILEPIMFCLLYTSPSPRDKRQSRMPSSA